MTFYRLGFLLILPVLTSAQVLPAGTQQSASKCSIEGRVLSLAGEPLRKANLTLRPVTDGPPVSNQTNAYTAETGADGKFVIDNLPPATYMLSAARVGYVNQSYGAKSPAGIPTRLKLAPGQDMTDLVIELTPQGLIYGKAADEDGDPVPNAQISVLHWTYLNGTRQLTQSGFGSSQADGSFVMGNLAPGRYILSASSRSVYYIAGIEITNEPHHESNLTTFYPNSLDAASAAPLDISAGAVLRGIEIRIRRGRTYEIRGHVQNATTFPNPHVRFTLQLYAKGSDSGPRIPRIAFVEPRAMTFQFKDFPAGTYIIRGDSQSHVRGASGEVDSIPLVGSIEVTIGDADIEDAVLPLSTGIEITGSFQTEGDAPAPDSHPRVLLQGLNASMGDYTGVAEAESDGSFRLRGLAQGLYHVDVNALPDGSYSKSIQFEGQDITSKDLDLSAGRGGELKILISPNSADVTGVVRNDKGDTVSSAIVQAFDGTRMRSSGVTDQNGAFHLRNLAPGEYKIFAWEDTMSGITQDAEFRKQFEEVKVKLVEKSHEKIDLKLIPEDAIEAEAAKLQ